MVILGLGLPSVCLTAQITAPKTTPKTTPKSAPKPTPASAAKGTATKPAAEPAKTLVTPPPGPPRNWAAVTYVSGSTIYPEVGSTPVP